MDKKHRLLQHRWRASLAFAVIALAIVWQTACSSLLAPKPSPTPTLAPTPSATTAAPPATAASPATLSVEEVRALLDGKDKPPIFDTRSRLAYDQEHVPGAISLPLGELSQRLAEIPKDRLTVLYCSGGT